MVKKGQFEQALQGARASHDVVASPNSKLLIAYTLRELGRYDEAYSEADAVAHEAEQAAQLDTYYAETARAAKAELAELRPRVALLSVTVRGASPGAKLSVAGVDWPRARWGRAVAVPAGDVAIELTDDGGKHLHSKATAAVGASVVVELDASPPPAPPPPAPVAVDDGKGRRAMRTGAYVAGGVGLVGAAVFGVFGVRSRSQFNDLRAACPDGRCAADRAGDIDAGRRDQTVANVGLAVGVVGLAAGATLFVLSRERAGEPAVAVGPGHVLVRGTF
jgi:hypothetical protein